LQNIQNDSKLKSKEIERLNIQNQGYRIKDLILKSEDYEQIQIIISREDNLLNIKEFGDRIREHISGKFIAVIGSISNKKPMIMCVVSKDLEEIAPANVIVSKLAPIIEGGGGGKKNIATAGGKNVEKIDDALDQSFSLIKDLLDE